MSETGNSTKWVTLLTSLALHSISSCMRNRPNITIRQTSDRNLNNTSFLENLQTITHAVRLVTVNFLLVKSFFIIKFSQYLFMTLQRVYFKILFKKYYAWLHGYMYVVLGQHFTGPTVKQSCIVTLNNIKGYSKWHLGHQYTMSMT